MKPLIATMSNLRNNRFDERLVNLIQLIWENDFFFEEVTMRNEVAKSLLQIADPITTLIFAYECIQMEPQDAVAGLILLEAAIKTGSNQIILQAADIVLSMKYRSSKIDYVSIAAAVRKQSGFAKHSSKRIACTDTRSQVRIGIRYFVNQKIKTQRNR